MCVYQGEGRGKAPCGTKIGDVAALLVEYYIAAKEAAGMYNGSPVAAQDERV